MPAGCTNIPLAFLSGSSMKKLTRSPISLSFPLNDACTAYSAEWQLLGNVKLSLTSLPFMFPIPRECRSYGLHSSVNSWLNFSEQWHKILCL
jgi:hypothetical protein